MEHANGYPYQFDPGACQTCRGICCRGSTGHVWITETEMKKVAAARKMDLNSFTQQYIRACQGKLALQERRVNGEYLCCFFDPLECSCTIYEHRPEQCRTYPFWKQFQAKPQEVAQECPGVRIKKYQPL